jgi:hypothetical protein
MDISSKRLSDFRRDITIIKDNYNTEHATLLSEIAELQEKIKVAKREYDIEQKSL